MSKENNLPNRYGYQPRDQWEANDLDAEAEHWRNDEPEAKSGGNCLLTFVGLLLVTAGLLYGTGVALAQAHDVMPVLQLDKVYMPYVGVGQ